MNFVEIAPPYAGTLFGLTNAIANICGFAAPYAVGLLVQGHVSFLMDQINDDEFFFPHLTKGIRHWFHTVNN